MPLSPLKLAAEMTHPGSGYISVIDRKPSKADRFSDLAYGAISGLKEALKDPTTYIPIGGGPLGKLGALLSGVGMSGDAEAAFISPSRLAKVIKDKSTLSKLAEALELSKKELPAEELWSQSGKLGFPLWRMPHENNRLVTEIEEPWVSGVLETIPKGSNWAAKTYLNPETMKPFNTVLNAKLNDIGRDLVKMYPELAKTKVNVRAMPSQSPRGSADPAGLAIDVTGVGPETAKEIYSHELQHLLNYADRAEGAASGANQQSVRYALANNPQVQELVKRLNLNPSDFSSTYKPIYYRSAGETTSRLSQARTPLTLKERIANPPWKELDFPIEDLWLNEEFTPSNFKAGGLVQMRGK